MLKRMIEEMMMSTNKISKHLRGWLVCEKDADFMEEHPDSVD